MNGDADMVLSLKDYRSKVLGCWMGKKIGGTIGAPFEWKRQVNNVTFYTQELGGNPLPNDDLDLQLLWLVALEEKGIDINARTLGEYWLTYITPHWAEYGIGKINMRSGLMPPLSGIENNPFKHSCGAYIRSEIWACIAPGCPETAARYAYEDAIVDHGDGEGMYAEIFCAALESAAFVVKDIYKLIEIGLSYIPDGCGIANAVNCAIAAYKSGKSWLAARDEILSKYRGSSSWFSISSEDKEKGFDGGAIGWDAPSNIGMAIIGLLYGEGDFEKTMCVTVNCGEDTDCTAATCGSIFGIMRGIEAIPAKWIAPIGKGIKTACLNLGELGYFGAQLPQNIDELSERTEHIAKQIILRNRLPVNLSEGNPSAFDDLKIESLYSTSKGVSIYKNLTGPVYRFDFFNIMIDYTDGATVKENMPKKLKIAIENTYKIPATLNVRWYTPDNWTVSPSKQGKVFSPVPWLIPKNIEMDFELLSERIVDTEIRFVIEVTIDGRHTVMLVPVVLINGNMAVDRQYI
jgi:ADP-ribosylglycohydrolase